jgi:hypothetical protein
MQDPFLGPDPLVTMGTNMLRQSGVTYLESGKRYMQSWTGVLSGGLLHYHFNIDTDYGDAPVGSDKHREDFMTSNTS